MNNNAAYLVYNAKNLKYDEDFAKRITVIKIDLFFSTHFYF